MTKKLDPSRWLRVAHCLQLAIANTIGRTFKMREHAGDDAGDDIKCWASKSAVLRKRVQCERNALALARVNACLMQGAAQSKTNALSQVINCIQEHGNSDGFIAVKCFQRVESGLSFHGSSSV